MIHKINNIFISITCLSINFIHFDVIFQLNNIKKIIKHFNYEFWTIMGQIKLLHIENHKNMDRMHVLAKKHKLNPCLSVDYVVSGCYMTKPSNCANCTTQSACSTSRPYSDVELLFCLPHWEFMQNFFWEIIIIVFLSFN